MNREAEFVSLASAPAGWRAVFAYDDERAPTFVLPVVGWLTTRRPNGSTATEAAVVDGSGRVWPVSNWETFFGVVAPDDDLPAPAALLAFARRPRTSGAAA